MFNSSDSAYWMLADTELPIAKEVSLCESFEAHFKHGLLFNERLMISDAQAVNCVNLRELVVNSSSFRELMTSGLLSIAVRDSMNDSIGESLTSIRDAFHKENKQHMSESRFLYSQDLEFLDDVCVRVPYTYSALRENYTGSILNIFSGDRAKSIFGRDVQNVLVDRLLTESERDNGLGRVFLHKNLETELKKIRKHNIWIDHKDFIKKLSDAPYVTGIPQILNTSPIYSPLHEESFQLAYPQSFEKIERGRKRELATDVNLSSYEGAIAKLHVEDILYLRDSYEYEKYQSYINFGVKNDNELDNAYDALISYQNLIDQYIIKRHLGKKTYRQFKCKRYIEPLRKISQEGGVFALGLALTENAIAGPVISIANFFASELIGQRAELSKSNFERERLKLKSQLKSDGGYKKIEAEQRLNKNKNETIYSSVK
ncbi:hypothetical protein [Enterovibrio norvegicus]|uniref:hypothetical protein n=1 Tax=Enterovibrio norvegicus TaxID=188144 RepID=UPI000C815EE5|nr:hypothetical protein [Enterovibrio norvegicus]PML75542.1 hypothetical protein BCT69_07030 [Enterovibrio norvegicus]